MSSGAIQLDEEDLKVLIAHWGNEGALARGQDDYEYAASCDRKVRKFEKAMQKNSASIPSVSERA